MKPKYHPNIKLLLLLLLLLQAGHTFAQNGTFNFNYVRTRVPRTTITSTTTLEAYTNLKDSVSITYQYIDGLGRPMQTVQQQGSPGGSDMVQPFIYGRSGRDSVKYLPYSISSTSPGSYRSYAITVTNGSYTTGEQYAFYQQTGKPYAATTTPYAPTAYEQSELNRVTEQGAPGTAWQLGGGHTVKMVYALNNQTAFAATPTANNPGSRMVALYTATINGDESRTLVRSGLASYPVGALSLTISKDENWNAASDGCLHTTEEYKDLDGHVLLKRTYNLNGSNIQMLSTYYVYDDYGDLAFVLPPMAMPDGSGVPTQATLDNLCYQYRYDEKGRITQKKLPGKGWEFIVYNTSDQVVMTQDANQRSKTPQQFTYTKYDGQGRVIITGLWNYTGSTADVNISAPNTTYLAWLQNTFNTTTSPKWETRDNTLATRYTNVSLPTDASGTYYTINYYDDYTMSSKPATCIAPTGASVFTKGLPTASRTTILSSPTNMLWTVNYYDDFGRTIQTYKEHYYGGAVSINNYDVVANTYTFTNQLKSTTRSHYNTSNSAASPIVTITDNYLYDHRDRKLQTAESINAATPTIISKTDYDEAGQVADKKLNSSDGTNFSQTINYAYNERGWLLSSTAGLFSEMLQYNTSTISGISPVAQYNGNIASQSWKTNGAASYSSYVYSYDALNRLNTGTGTTGNTESGITYDLQGNITALNRFKNSTATHTLSYAYLDAGSNPTNQLQSVTNTATNTTDLLTGKWTYAYDYNGNLKQSSYFNSSGVADPTKTKSTTYNLLNLPQTYTINGGTITFSYDAAGNKLRKVSTQGTGYNTDYDSGIQYKPDGTIDFIQTEEGRVINPTTTPNYEYTLSDHLGDTRLTFDIESNAATSVQQDDYYPFGMEISNGTIVSPKNEYLYNKKELQEDLGVYDYGARFYDPVIARWTVIDPLAEISRRWSPYNYGEDNSIKNIDPDGMDVVVNLHGQDAQDYVRHLQSHNASGPGGKKNRPSLSSLIFSNKNYKEAPHLKPITGFWEKTFKTLFGDRTLGGTRTVDHVVYDDNGNPIGTSYITMLEFPMFTDGPGEFAELPQLGEKLKYLFGEAQVVAGDTHNVDRSIAMYEELKKIGIINNSAGKAFMAAKLAEAFKTEGIVQSNGRIMRETFIMGPKGGVVLQSVWEGTKLITVKIFGGK